MPGRKKKPRGRHPSSPKPKTEGTSVSLGLAVAVAVPFVGAAFVLGNMSAQPELIREINEHALCERKLAEGTAHAGPLVVNNYYINSTETGTGNTLRLTADTERTQ